MILIPGRHSRMLLAGIQKKDLDTRLRGHDKFRKNAHFSGALVSVWEIAFRDILTLVLASTLLLCPSRSWSFLEFSGSPNPVGSGARALGMGGAFIAVADDATAASWNPGGLIQLETPELSVVGSGLYRVEDNTLGKHPEGSGAQYANAVNLNFLSFTYPFRVLERDMVVSLSYQHLFDFTRNWNWTLNFSGAHQRYTYHYQQDGGLYAWGLAYCAQLLPTLSLGFTLNLWEDGIYSNGWREELSLSYRGHGLQRVQRVGSEYAFSGFNANIGLLWAATDRLTFGAVFKTPFTGDLTHQYSDDSLAVAGTTPGKTHQKLDMPMSYGLGLAYQPHEHLTLSADVYRTHWQDFMLTDATGTKVSAVNGLPPAKADIDPTTQVRLGAEYLFVKPHHTIPLRAGLFYDPGPAKGSPDTYYGCSIGSGIGIGRFIFDFAYQYRFGRNVTSAIYRNMGFNQDVDEHTIYSSLIIHF